MCECEPFQLDASAANMFTHYSVSVYLLISHCCKKILWERFSLMSFKELCWSLQFVTCCLKVQGLKKFLNTRPPKTLGIEVIYMLSTSPRGFIVYSDLCRRQQHRLSVFHILSASALSFVAGSASCFWWLLSFDNDTVISNAPPLCHPDSFTSEGLDTSTFPGWTRRLFWRDRVFLSPYYCGPGTDTLGLTDFVVPPLSGFHSSSSYFLL